MKSAHGAFFGAAAIALAACGGGGTSIALFTTEWTDDGGKSIAEIQAKLASARVAPGADVAIGVAGNGDKLIGRPLDGGASSWTFAHKLDARPVVAGSVVVASGGGEIVALDAKSGARLWARPSGGLRVLGAGDDGHVTVVTFRGATGGGSILLAVRRDGSVERQIETERSLGAPAVVGGYALLPWGNVYLSALDLEQGDEAARVVLREKASRAWQTGGATYFGEIGIFRFDDKTKDAPKSKATHVSLPVRELPGSPKLMEDEGEAPGPAADARAKIRVYARPADADGALGVDSNRYYATYFRFVTGFDATKGTLAWVHTHGSDVLGGAAGAGTITLCDEQGHVTTLDAKTGGQVSDVDLGEPVKGCVVQIDAMAESGAPAAMPPLAEQLSQALLDPAPEMATAKRLFLRELAALDDETATKTLIALASDERTSPFLIADAREALANRRNGARFMLEALGEHYDFLRDVLRPPPVGPMAQALAAMNETRAAPLLASHLLDPADTDDDVKRAADALVKLAGPSEAPTLKQFFGTYRASAPNEEIEQAVAAAGQALARVGGPDGYSTVQAAMDDPLSLEGVRQRLKSIVLVPPAAANDADAGAPKKK